MKQIVSKKKNTGKRKIYEIQEDGGVSFLLHIMKNRISVYKPNVLSDELDKGLSKYILPTPHQLFDLYYIRDIPSICKKTFQNTYSPPKLFQLDDFMYIYIGRMVAHLSFKSKNYIKTLTTLPLQQSSYDSFVLLQNNEVWFLEGGTIIPDRHVPLQLFHESFNDTYTEDDVSQLLRTDYSPIPSMKVFYDREPFCTKKYSPYCWNG